jgi:cyclopropane-fatty-acyl-phospholipid synthase
VCDYRKTLAVDGGYDRIVSVEMVEHVGRKHMDDYFGAISKMLKATGGIVDIQGITIINGISLGVGQKQDLQLIKQLVLQVAC